ncbi:MAG: hypothetical protein IJ679_10465 [Lachnospiraceae bacterium]|nr:hypothetical protein [Lachnospiraceae bacterium]
MSIAAPCQGAEVPIEMRRTMSEVKDRGSREMHCRIPPGNRSVEKKVLHRNDIGVMI